MLQHPRRLEETFGVEAHYGQAAQRFCAQIAMRQPVDGLLENGGRPFVITGIEVVQCRAKPTLGRIATEADRQVHQFSRRRGGATRSRRFRRLVERPECDVITVGRRQRQMPGAQFGLVDEFGEPAVHRAASGECGLRVDTPGQQGVRKVDPVAVDRDNALALGDFEQLDQPVVVADRRSGHQLHRRRRHARRREQRLVDIGIQAPEPTPDDIAECARKRRDGGTGRSFVERPGQLDCVERVSTRHFVNASHRGAGEGSPQPGGDRGVQLVDAQRIQANTVDRLGPWQLQPGRARAFAGLGAHTAQDPDGSGEATRGECEDVNAGGIKPLQIVDRQQDRASLGESLDH